MLQLDFLRILCSHEHLTALNLPIFFDQAKTLSTAASTSQKKFIIESNDYFAKHFLVGLVLRQSFKSLHSSFASVQFKCVQLLRNIIEANDIDPRLASNKKARAHLAYMYMPFINLFIHFTPLMAKKLRDEEQPADTDELIEDFNDSLLTDHDTTANTFFQAGSDTDFIETSLNLDEFDLDLDRNNDFHFGMDDILNEDVLPDILHDKLKSQNSSVTNNSGSSGGTGLKNFRKISQQISKADQFQKKSKQPAPAASPSLSQSAAQRQRKARTILTRNKPCCDFYNLRLNLMLIQDSSSSSSSLDSTSTLSVESSQDLLVCFLWILKNMDKELLFKVWKQWSHVKLKKLLVLFDLCVSHLEFKNTVWSEFVASRLADDDLSINSIATAKSKNASLNGSLSGQKGVLLLNSPLSSKGQKTARQYFNTPTAGVQQGAVSRMGLAKGKVEFAGMFFKKARYFKYTDPKCGVEMLTYDLSDCVSGSNKPCGLGGEDPLSYTERLALEGNLFSSGQFENDLDVVHLAGH